MKPLKDNIDVILSLSKDNKFKYLTNDINKDSDTYDNSMDYLGHF